MQLLMFWCTCGVLILILTFILVLFHAMPRESFLDLDEINEDPDLYRGLDILTSDREPATMKDVDTLRYTEVREMMEAMSPGMYYLRTQRPECYEALKNIVFIKK